MTRLFIFILFFLCPILVSAQQTAVSDTIQNPETAIAQLHQAIKKDSKKDALLFCQMAERKNQISEYDSAIYYSNICVQLLLADKNNFLLARTLHAKGIAQYYLDDKIKAEDNWRQSLQLSIAVKDSSRTIKLASNLGAIYLDKAYAGEADEWSYKTADSFLTIAYNELKRIKKTETMQGLLTLRLIATSFHFQKKYDSADIYYRKVIKTSKGNTGVYTGALSFYAEALSETGRHREALNMMEEVMKVIKDSNVVSKDKTHYMHVYGQILLRSGQGKEAYMANDSAYKLLAADYQKINAQAYAESESKFKNQLLQYQVALEKQKRNKLYYLIAGTALLAFFVFLWLYNRNKKKIAQEKARQKQISIDAFIEGEEKEKVRIGRELHDGIAQEIVGIKLAMQQQKADPILVNELSRISLDIRNISHELMPQTLKDYGLKVAIEDVCQKILAPSGIYYEIASTLSEVRMVNKIEITLYRIFQELVHNIIKHSGATEVLIQLRKMNTHVLLMVEDNGKGITHNKKTGIGISNLKSRVQLVDGNLQYESSENEGTTAIVRVPI
jgi:signal transduction histidine kinase